MFETERGEGRRGKGRKGREGREEGRGDVMRHKSTLSLGHTNTS